MGQIVALIPVAISAIGSSLAAAGTTAAAAASSASALTIASTALAAGGALYGGIAANQAGKYQAKVLGMQAQQAEKNRSDALIAGQDRESKLKMMIARTIGSQRAAMAANGVDVDVGSAVDIADSTRLEGAADVATAHYQAMQEAYGFSQDAWNARAGAKMAKAEGKQKLIGSLFEAGSTVLGGASALKKASAANQALGVGRSFGKGYSTSIDSLLMGS